MNPYLPFRTTRQANRANQWELGRADRLNNQPCSSVNGAYLEGWYSVKLPDKQDEKQWDRFSL